MNKLVRITTVPLSLVTLLKGQMRFMSKSFEVIAISSEGSELNEVAEKEGVKVESVNLTRKITPISDFLAVITLYKILKREKPVIVHTHTPKAGIVGMVASKLAGVPIRMHTVAGMPLMESSGIKKVLLNFVEKLTYSFATNVYPNSKGLYDFILFNGYTISKKLKVIGNGSSNGINTNYFNAELLNSDSLMNLRNDLKIHKNDFVFVFVGRLVGDKGINELVQAFLELMSSNLNKNIKLLLVGSQEPELDPLLPNTINEINNNINIISVGFQKDVRPYYAVSSALVFPSYREGFPNVVMQAGSMGLPSIVSNINGCNEIILEGENGTIIPVKNIKFLNAAMKKMIYDFNYYSKLKLNSRRLIVERYEQEIIWRNLLTEYKTLIENRL